MSIILIFIFIYTCLVKNQTKLRLLSLARGEHPLREGREKSAPKDQKQTLLKCELTLVFLANFYSSFITFDSFIHTQFCLYVIAHAQMNSRAPIVNLNFERARDFDTSRANVNEEQLCPRARGS